MCPSQKPLSSCGHTVWGAEHGLAKLIWRFPFAGIAELVGLGLLGSQVPRPGENKRTDPPAPLGPWL